MDVEKVKEEAAQQYWKWIKEESPDRDATLHVHKMVDIILSILGKDKPVRSREEGNKTVRVEGVECYHESPKAFLIGPPDAKDSEKVWVPKSQIEADFDAGWIEMPLWLAEDKKLAYEELD